MSCLCFTLFLVRLGFLGGIRMATTVQVGINIQNHELAIFSIQMLALLMKAPKHFNKSLPLVCILSFQQMKWQDQHNLHGHDLVASDHPPRNPLTGIICKKTVPHVVNNSGCVPRVLQRHLRQREVDYPNFQLLFYQEKKRYVKRFNYCTL